ncbi:peptidase A8 [Herbaspirillum rubrisubalbicans]|jgi:peptidoglycan/xylan/chitin deacetylase (PgdA/CDA1 family)|uniref:Peptidase A8 n=1 Tax=Herbaspirillum rubrisubalbicans TaxID=80842 RepID=A0ABX9BVI9_9BURK|nr:MULTISPECIES: polysaccharide deacetylase family protein [Herbaspirillum]MCP1577055.1 peptidoglycan/xylan/chitin deacetylase (PgdA/CDA1 family) [Herbaspirillum rubrisubalbicans]NQE51386.1 peptidase A8 [Herbaspirillum rubrisubalbicans]RAM61821.1 peptidase A8 [Herbaspirillum rubrisubalbicans]RAN43948.1 peptidase A8 [Herbaspirillum rubrisubalbicans]
MMPPISKHSLRGLCLFAILAAGQAVAQSAAPEATAAPACKGRIYLTFDTGSQSQAELIEQTLQRHHIHATFFLANEKTIHGDYSLDPAWAPLWKRLVAEGNAFGTHTFDHVYVVRDLPGGKIEVRPQFGAQAGKKLQWTPAQYCEEMKRVDERFQQLTGHKLDPLWRAPGGRLTPNLLKAGQACGYAHVAWAPAGFSGDELPSDKFPNAMLLKKALDGLKDGDIFLAHMGIWSRQDPWAPAVLEPLISGLEQKGFCFATLREHPAYRHLFVAGKEH